MFPLLLLAIPIVSYFLFRKPTLVVVTAQSVTRDLPPPDPYAGMNLNAVPPCPRIAGGNIVLGLPQWYKASDDLSNDGIIQARQLTVRQIQTIYNSLGAHLQVNGDWDLSTMQATWDFQFLHESDNPQNLLNITGEMDITTQSTLKTVFANNILSSLANNPDIHVPGSEAWKQYNAARSNNPWA